MPRENEEETVLDAVNAALGDELAPESETPEPETEEERKFLASRPPIRISIPLVMCWRPPDAIPAE